MIVVLAFFGAVMSWLFLAQILALVHGYHGLASALCLALMVLSPIGVISTIIYTITGLHGSRTNRLELPPGGPKP